MQCCWKKMPCYPANTMDTTCRKPTENPRSKMPSFSRKHCYHCSDLKKCPVIQPHDGENVEKTHRKPKEKHALVIQKTQQNDGENHLKNLRNTCRCTQTTSKPSSQAPRLGAGALRPQADAARRLGELVNGTGRNVE